ncbi:Prefoldin 6 [Carabus blaptoides fortunei]
MNKTLDDIQKKLQNELDCFKQVQKEHHKILSTRQQLDAQLNENEIVKKELDILKDDNLVYKLVGPVLIKTDQTEAKQNVSKRIEYISKELKRIDDNLTGLDKKQDAHRENLQKLQHQFQQARVKAAINS